MSVSRSMSCLPQGRVAVHQPLDLGEVAGRAALHQVAGHGEGTAGEADQRHGQLPGQQAGPPRARRGCRPRGRGGAAAAGPPWTGRVAPPPARCPGRCPPRSRWRPPAPRCRRRRWRRRCRTGSTGWQGQLRHQLGPGDGVEDAARSAGGPVLGEGTAGLAHEPDRHPGHRQAAAGPEEGGVLVAAGGRVGHHLTLSPRRGPRRSPRPGPGAGRHGGSGRRAYNQGFPSAGRGRTEVPVGVQGELQAEQDFVDLAYARLDAMRDDARSMRDGVLDLGRGGTFQSRDRARRHRADQHGPARAAGHRRPGADLRPDRPRRSTTRATTGGPPSDTVAIRRGLPHRATGHPRQRPRAPGGGLAGPRRRAVLPGHRARPQGLVLRRHLALDGRQVVGCGGRALLGGRRRPGGEPRVGAAARRAAS